MPAYLQSPTVKTPLTIAYRRSMAASEIQPQGVHETQITSSFDSLPPILCSLSGEIFFVSIKLFETKDFAKKFGIRGQKNRGFWVLIPRKIQLGAQASMTTARCIDGSQNASFIAPIVKIGRAARAERHAAKQTKLKGRKNSLYFTRSPSGPPILA
jgi:hypothetical protein